MIFSLKKSIKNNKIYHAFMKITDIDYQRSRDKKFF